MNLYGFGDTTESTKVRHLETGVVYVVTEKGKLQIRVFKKDRSTTEDVRV